MDRFGVENDGYQTLKIVRGEQIKCGAALHVGVDSLTGRLQCGFADAAHGQNAVAVEDITGSEVWIEAQTGRVRNVKE